MHMQTPLRPTRALWLGTAFVLLTVGCTTRGVDQRLARMERRVDSLAVTVTAMNAYIQRQGIGSALARPETVTVQATGRVLGSAKAPVTIVEFTDFQCPFCGQHATTTFPIIRSKYIATGEVRYVMRDFPLVQIHPYALPAAIAARCVAVQGLDKFWAYHDSLFAHQRDFTDGYFSAVAARIGLAMPEYGKCVASGRYDASISLDAKDARKAGFDGTPGFVIGRTRGDGTVVGIAIRGAFPIGQFENAIAGALHSEKALAK